MGWLVPYHMPRLRDLIADRVRRETRTNPDGAEVRHTALRHCYRGGRFSGVLYIAWEVTRTPPGGPPETTRFLEVDLVRYYRDVAGGNWGYKDMDEGMGPNCYSCPLSYLDLVPPDSSEYAVRWRERVRAWHAERAAKRAEQRARRAS